MNHREALLIVIAVAEIVRVDIIKLLHSGYTGFEYSLFICENKHAVATKKQLLPFLSLSLFKYILSLNPKNRLRYV